MDLIQKSRDLNKSMYGRRKPQAIKMGTLLLILTFTNFRLKIVFKKLRSCAVSEMPPKCLVIVSCSDNSYFYTDKAISEKYIKRLFRDWSLHVGPGYSSCFES